MGARAPEGMLASPTGVATNSLRRFAGLREWDALRQALAAQLQAALVSRYQLSTAEQILTWCATVPHSRMREKPSCPPTGFGRASIATSGATRG